MMTRPLSDEDASPSNASPDQPAMKKMKVDMPEDDSVIVKEVVPGATTETPSVAPANAPVQPPAHVAPKPKSNLPTEKDMHISSYISAHIPGFHGIIKHRFSDFMVNEVDLNGKVTHLINLEPPASVIASEKPKTVDDDEAGLSELSQLLNDPDLIESLKEVLSTGTLPEGGLTTEPITDKESRKKVHEIVKLYFSKALSTTTSAESGIKFQRPTKRDNQRSVKPQWSELGGEYLHFTLYKENKDTMEAVDLVSKHIRGSSKTFGFAGTKDKRGITSQRVSGLRVSATQLANLNARLNGVKTGDYSYHTTPLKLGDLQGNRFTIVLR